MKTSNELYERYGELIRDAKESVKKLVKKEITFSTVTPEILIEGWGGAEKVSVGKICIDNGFLEVYSDGYKLKNDVIHSSEWLYILECVESEIEEREGKQRKEIMKQKEFKANQEYLEGNDIYLSDDAVWDSYPYSRELYFRTPAGGDFSICVEEMNKESIIQALQDFDINENTLLWWNSDRTSFETIKDLYDDIYQWKEDFIQIAEGMPY